MDLAWPDTDIAFRDEVRTFLRDELAPELRQAGRLMTTVYSDQEASLKWQSILHERGSTAPAWPVEHAIIAYGTPEQKDYFHPRILTAEVFFCQGYSEPESGSDLVSPSMCAVDDGDDLVCTGSKMWTTHAGDVRPGPDVARSQETTGHHVRADRHELARHPDPAAGHDIGRRGRAHQPHATCQRPRPPSAGRPGSSSRTPCNCMVVWA